MKRQWSISIKLWLAMTLLILFVLGSLGSIITWLFGDFYLKQKLDDLGREAKDISLQLASRENWTERFFVLENLRFPSGTQLVLLNTRGEILAVKGEVAPTGPRSGMGWRGMGSGMGSGMGGAGWRSNALKPTDFFSRENLSEVLEGKILSIKAILNDRSGQAMLIAAAPLGSPAEGVVLLGSSPTPVQESISTFRRIIFYSSLFAVVLATFVSLVFARQVTRPLGVMQRAASRMAKGDFQPIKGVNSKDELGELAEALNAMGESLQNHVSWLSQERNLLQGIVEGISDAVIMLDANGAILYTNDPAKALWQENLEDTERKEKIINFLKELAQSPEEKRSANLTLGTQVLAVSVASTPESEGVKGYVAVLRDVTASLRAEKERRDFLASVTHELRTPLHLIQGYLEAIQDGVIPPSKQPEHIELVLDEAKRLARLVQGLQEINKLERWQSLDLRVINLKEFLQDLNHRFQTRAAELGIKLHIIPVEGEIVADRDRLLQVFINLLDNALRHTPAGKNVKVWLEYKENKICFAVADEGEGIPQYSLPHIFERFYRVDKARSRKEGGMGLGLAIVKQIVEAHGGEIRVESKLGVGTTFWIELPVRHASKSS